MRPIILGSTCPKNILPDAFQIRRVFSDFRRLAVELGRIPEHEPNICIQVLEARIRLLLSLGFDSREIAGILFMDDVPVVRDVEGDRVDRPVKCPRPRIGVNR